VNSQNFKTVKTFIRIGLFIFFSIAHVQVRAWDVDFSRRTKDLKTLRLPASIVDQPQSQEASLMGLGPVFESLDPAQEIVILNTDSGFVPSTLKLRRGQNYQIHIVNVNDKEKNTSFILDAFSEHHATYFGQKKSFTISPKQDGIFSFVCPETAKQGRLVIFSDDRKPASQ
jgi:hypothetical protein